MTIYVGETKYDIALGNKIHDESIVNVGTGYAASYSNLGDSLPLAPAKKPFTWVSESGVSIQDLGFTRGTLKNNTNKNWTSSSYVKYEVDDKLYVRAIQSFNGYLDIYAPENCFLTYLKVYSKQNSNTAYCSSLRIYRPDNITDTYIAAKDGDYGWVEWSNEDGKECYFLRLYAARSHTDIGGAGNTTCEISEMRGYMLVGGNQ